MKQNLSIQILDFTVSNADRQTGFCVSMISETCYFLERVNRKVKVNDNEGGNVEFPSSTTYRTGE